MNKHETVLSWTYAYAVINNIWITFPVLRKTLWASLWRMRSPTPRSRSHWPTSFCSATWRKPGLEQEHAQWLNTGINHIGMAAIFGKIIFGIYVDIKRSDGRYTTLSTRPNKNRGAHPYYQRKSWMSPGTSSTIIFVAACALANATADLGRITWVSERNDFLG